MFPVNVQFHHGAHSQSAMMEMCVLWKSTNVPSLDLSVWVSQSVSAPVPVSLSLCVYQRESACMRVCAWVCVICGYGCHGTCGSQRTASGAGVFLLHLVWDRLFTAVKIQLVGPQASGESCLHLPFPVGHWDCRSLCYCNQHFHSIWGSRLSSPGLGDNCFTHGAIFPPSGFFFFILLVV